MTRSLYSLLCLLLVAAVASFARQHTPAQEARSEAIAPNDREYAALALLTAVGNAQPSRGIVNEVVAWSIAEDGSEGAMGRNNPWNTTICGYNMLGSINADGACGVQAYATFDDGIAANAATLAQANFAEVRSALLGNDPEAFKRALWSSGWAASHYNGGVGWPHVEETQARKCLPTDTGAISAHFDSTGSPFWAGQAGGMHNGTDYSGNPGDPVYAPFDLTVEDIQYYGDARRIGWYVQGRFSDGYLFYAGHLGTVAVAVGQAVPACTPIGTIGEVFHTHVKINRPGLPEPCEATGCDNFEEYFNER